MYYVNKVIGFLASPAGIAFAGFLLAFVSSKTRFGRVSGRIAAFSAVWLWIWMMPATTRVVGVPLEDMSGSGCVVDFSSIPETEIAVLLGGGMSFHAECSSPELSSGADRALVAARLWKSGKVKRLFLTGSEAVAGTLPFLKELGVDPDVCSFFEEARNTQEEAAIVSKAADGRIVLVTSAWHMPRAKLLFERRGFEVIPCPADFEMHYVAERDVRFSDFIPSGEAFSRNCAAMKEWVALAGYKMFL